MRPDQLLCHHFLDGFVLPWERGFCPYPPPSKSPLCQWFSKAGLETSNISITWELARKAASPVSPHPRPPDWDTLGWGQSSVFEGSFQVFLMLIQVLSTAALGHGSPRQGGHSGVRSEGFCWRHTHWPERKLGLMPEVFIWLWFRTVLFVLTENGMDGLAGAAGIHVDTRWWLLSHTWTHAHLPYGTLQLSVGMTNQLLSAVCWRETHFLILICHLCLFFGEMSI